MATPRLVIKHLEQGSDEWLKWRRSVIGASEGYRAMSMSKDLWLVKTGLKEASSFTNRAMEHGTALEDEARQTFIMEHMEDVVPMCGQRSFIGASADGVNRKGKFGIEIKCPSSEKVHNAHCRDEIEPQYQHQCQQVMYVFGLKKMYFISYMPGHAEPYHETVVLRNNSYIKQMVDKLTAFWERVQKVEWPEDATAVSNAVARVIPDAAPAMSDENCDALIGVAQANIAAANELQINTLDDAEVGADLLRGLNEMAKRIEERRKEIVGPHNDYVSEVNARFKEATAPITNAIASLKKKEKAFMESEAMKSVRGEVGVVSLRASKPMVKVVNINDVPKEYLVLDVDKKAVIEAFNEGKDIPGIEVSVPTTVVAK